MTCLFTRIGYNMHSPVSSESMHAVALARFRARRDARNLEIPDIQPRNVEILVHGSPCGGCTVLSPCPLACLELETCDEQLFLPLGMRCSWWRLSRALGCSDRVRVQGRT